MPTYPMTGFPVLTAAVAPLLESSTATYAIGGAPSCSHANRYIAGSGLEVGTGRGRCGEYTRFWSYKRDTAISGRADNRESVFAGGNEFGECLVCTEARNEILFNRRTSIIRFVISHRNILVGGIVN
ncbi:hypothetical protein BDP27DRAFT_1310864 [Rhodocollybia butyracea]|uniref:Uncharacterized protein n=1 Tax=Rhodocollybia butyracea TaxID=206335 RepID=A0A9P5UFC6_9AGAR|nr:hypothetical protein BDP27DRAFT_1310864 [Rhodocollybia butyracea]